MDDRLLTPQMVEDIVLTPSSTLREWVQSGTFPPPLPLPDGRELWRRSDVVRWMTLLAANVTPEITPSAASDFSGASSGAANEAGGSEQGEHLSPLAWKILHALADEGTWISGAELAGMISERLDHRSGGFWSATRRLRVLGLIETKNTHGYRATESGIEASLRQRDSGAARGASNEAGGSLSDATD